MSEPLRHVYQVYIRTTPENLWDAITNPEVTQQYFFGGRYESDWKPGSPLVLRNAANGELMLDCKVLEVDKPRKIVQTFNPSDTPEDKPSKVTWEIQPLGDTCLLSVTHEHYNGESKVAKSTQEGWPIVLSGLKTLVETGKPLTISWPQEAAAT